MTRGTYRLYNEPLTGVIRLPFYGNHWRLRPGHRIRLDLTQVDTPTYRASNFPSSIQFPEGVTLELPTREAGARAGQAPHTALPRHFPDDARRPAAPA